MRREAPAIPATAVPEKEEQSLHSASDGHGSLDLKHLRESYTFDCGKPLIRKWHGVILPVPFAQWQQLH